MVAVEDREQACVYAFGDPKLAAPGIGLERTFLVLVCTCLVQSVPAVFTGRLDGRRAVGPGRWMGPFA